MAKKESKRTLTGSDYAEGRYTVPWNAGVSSGMYGDRTSKTVHSPAPTTFEPPLEIRSGYDKLWNGK